MPNANTHIRTAFFIGVITTPLAYYAGLPLQDAGIVGASIFASEVFLSPDLDLNAGSKAYRKWGPLQWFWKPYQLAIGHRSFLSHSGPFSFTLRFLYLLLPLFILVSLTNISLDNWYRVMVLCWIGGSLGDTVHTLLDKTRIK